MLLISKKTRGGQLDHDFSRKSGSKLYLALKQFPISTQGLRATPSPRLPRKPLRARYQGEGNGEPCNRTRIWTGWNRGSRRCAGGEELVRMKASLAASHLLGACRPEKYLGSIILPQRMIGAFWSIIGIDDISGDGEAFQQPAWLTKWPLSDILVFLCFDRSDRFDSLGKRQNLRGSPHRRLAAWVIMTLSEIS